MLFCWKEVNGIKALKTHTIQRSRIFASVLILSLLGLSLLGEAQEPPSFYQEAQGFLQEGKIPQAINALKQGLLLDPDFPEGWVLLGQIYLQQGKHEEAISSLTKARSIQPEAKVFLLLGQAYQFQGRYGEAIENYQRVLQIDPAGREAERSRKYLSQIGQTPEEAQRARAHFDQASRFMNQGMLQEALNEIQGLLTILPEHLAGLLLQGGILARQGKTEEAEESLRRAVSIEPGFQRAYFELGGIYLSIGQTKKAILEYQRVLELNPKNSLGREAEKKLRQLGRTPEDADQATQLFSEAVNFAKAKFLVLAYERMKDVLELTPDNPKANFFMAEIQTDLNLLDDSIASYNRILEVEPQSYTAFFKRGFTFQLKGMLKEALVSYQAAQLLGVNSAEAKEAQNQIPLLGGSADGAWQLEGLVRQAKEQFQKENFEGALTLYGEALALAPNNVDVHYERGLILKRAGRSEEAIAALQSALAVNPKLFEAHYTLGLIFEGEGRIPDALKSYQLAIGFGKGKDELEDAEQRVAFLTTKGEEIELAAGHIEQAKVFRKEGDLKGAIGEYQKAVALSPEVASTYLNLAELYILSGQIEGAFRNLMESLQREPQMVQARFSLGVVYQKRGLYFEAMNEFRRVLTFGTDEKEVELARKELEVTIESFFARTESFAVYREGLQKMDAGDEDGALASFERVAELDPLNFENLFQVGVLLKERLQIEKAIFFFQQASDLRSWDPEVHKHLGELYEQQQAYDQAIVEFRIYGDLISEDQKMEEEAGGGREKIQALKEKRVRAKQEAQRQFSNALAHIKEEKFDIAEEELKAAIFLDPTNPVYHANLGFALFAANKRQEAMYIYRRTLSLNPQYAQAHLSLANIFEENGSYLEALEAFDMAIEHGLEGGDLQLAQEGRDRVEKVVERMTQAEGHRVKGFEFAKEGKNEEALEEYLKANEIQEESTTFTNIGLIYESMGENEKAEEAFLKAVDLKKDDLQLVLQLGEFYREQDRLKEAQEVYEQIIETGGEDPEKEEVRLARERLELLRKKVRISVNHTFLTFDSNRRSTAENEEIGLSTNFGINANYTIMRTRKISLPLNLSVRNYFEMRSQIYVNSESLASRLRYAINDEYSVNMLYSFNYSMTTRGPSAHSHTFTLDGTRSGKWPTSASLQYSLVKNISFITRLNDWDRHTLTLSLSQILRQVNGSVGFNYSVSVSSAVRQEQENTSHAMGLSYTMSLLPTLSGNAGYSFSFLDFPNEDVLLRTRQILNHGVNAGLSYSVSPGFRFNFSYSFTSSNSNLSAIPQDIEDLLADQVIPLEKFKKHVLSFTASLAF